MDKDNRKLQYTIADAVTLTSLTRSMLYKFIQTGELKTRKIGKRRFILASELERFLRTDHATPRNRKPRKEKR